jgi:LysM repeat protein
MIKLKSFLFKLAGLLCLLLLFDSTPALSQQTSDVHTVQQGETLFSIARDFNITVGDLRRWNNLENDDLRPGQTIRITPPVADNQITHTVRQGETLFSISRSYGVTIAEIQQWNELRSNSLELGRELTIFLPDDERIDNEGGEALQQLTGQGEVAEPEERQSIVRVADISPANTYYTVRSGDTLFKIAGDHGMTIQELRTLNNLEGDMLRIGQQLIVRETESSAPNVADNAEESTPQGRFVQYRLQRGESGRDLMSKFQMSERELRALNPGTDIDELSSGQRVTVLLPPNRTYENPYRRGASLQDLGSVPVFSYRESDIASPTTSGELYNPEQLTAAHSNMSLGNVIYIENPRNGRGLYVKINDRHSGEGLKLSARAFDMLGLRTIDSPVVTIYLEN